MSDILHWMIKRCDYSVSWLREIDTEEQRVSFLTKAAQTIHAQLKIELHLKTLYIAETEAVVELMKIAKLLYTSSRETQMIQEYQQKRLSESDWRMLQHDAQRLQHLLANLSETGFLLCRDFQNESKNKTARVKALDIICDPEEIKDSIKGMTLQLEASIQSQENQVKEHYLITERLQTLVDSKKTELRRHEKRFAALQNVRPAYMDEYEKLRLLQQSLFQDYGLLYNTKKYLESLLEKQESAYRARQRTKEKRIQKMQKKWRKEEQSFIQGDTDLEKTSSSSVSSSVHSQQHYSKPIVEVLTMESEDATFVDGRRVVGTLNVEHGDSELEIDESSEDITIDEDTDSASITLSHDHDIGKIGGKHINEGLYDDF